MVGLFLNEFKDFLDKRWSFLFDDAVNSSNNCLIYYSSTSPNAYKVKEYSSINYCVIFFKSMNVISFITGSIYSTEKDWRLI